MKGTKKKAEKEHGSPSSGAEKGIGSLSSGGLKGPNRGGTMLNTLLGAICVSLNLGGGIIVIGEDRAGRILEQHARLLEKRKGWIPPLCLFLPLFLALLTTSFKSFSWIEGSLLQGAFLVGGIVCFLWLVVAVIQSLRAKSVEDVLTLLREGQKLTFLELSEKADQSGLNGPLWKLFTLVSQSNPEELEKGPKSGGKWKSAKK